MTLTDLNQRHKDECDFCGHERRKHRVRTKCCTHHDHIRGAWIECPCEGFQEPSHKTEKLEEGK